MQQQQQQQQQVTLLRHCEATHNVDEANISSTKDTPLTDLGRQQARMLGGHYTEVWVSPLRRCRDTLRESGITYDRMRVTPLLREHVTEECDLLPHEPDGQRESEPQFLARVARLRAEIAAEMGGGASSLLLVTHADLIWQLTANRSKFGQWLDNGETWAMAAADFCGGNEIQRLLLLMTAIPADVAMETLAAFVDARDLMRMDAMCCKQIFAATRGAFRASRVLDRTELAWFAKHGLRVDLLRTSVTVEKEGQDPAIRALADNCKHVVTQTTWLCNGRPHREDDLPAIERSNGDREWFWEGKRHRGGDRPAVDWTYNDAAGNRRLEWWVHGRQHRENDLPAVTGVDWRGPFQQWFWRGMLHRGNDRPATVYGDGTQAWYQKGRQHRGGDQPAMIWPGGRRAWFEHGQRYRMHFE